MASYANTNAYITVNGVDLTPFVRSSSLKVAGEELDDTAMGDDWRSRLGGLKDWSISIEFNQDFAASGVDQTLWALLNTVTAVIYNPAGSTTSTTNPRYSGNVLVSDYSPMDGSVGDLATVSVSWNASGALARATS